MGIIQYPCGCKFHSDGPDAILHEVPRTGLSGIDVDIYNLSLECPITWQLLAKGKTKGVFQLESHLGRHWAKKVNPSELEDLSALVSLLRPGCLKALSGDPPKSMTQRYCDRKLRMEPVTYYHSALEPILKTTYGVLVYQEQAMKTAVALAGFNEQEADVLRKAIGKKKPEIMAALENDFVSGCAKVGLVSEEQAKEIFGWIRESQRYSFNKSHAICYGLDSYWTAFCKAHFPLQFYCSYIEGSLWKQDTQEEVSDLVNDAKLEDIPIQIPDFRHQEDVTYIRDDTVYFSLGNIKTIGEAALEKIKQGVQATEIELNAKVDEWDWIHFLIYFSDRVSSTSNTALIMSGALDYLKLPRTRMSYEFDLWNKLTDKEKEWIQAMTKTPEWYGKDLLHAFRSCASPAKAGGGCKTAKRVEIVKSIVSMLENPPHSLTDTPDLIAWNEERFLGVSITCHKVDSCEGSMSANATCKDIIAGHSGYTVIAVSVNRIRPLVTKKGKNPGQKMAILSVSDSSCSLDEVVVFPTEWKNYEEFLYEGNTVLIQGEKDRVKNSFVVKKVSQI